jgi:16S rRNA (uracil1498-N3)-methyltransferase
MRVGEQEDVLLFDGASGEWLAKVALTGRRTCTPTPFEQTRAQPASTASVALHFALLKPKRLTQLCEKATELGATTLCPLVSERTVVRSANVDKLRAICMEAAEQSGRLSVPDVLEPSESLADCLRAAAADGARVFACDERPGCETRLIDVLRQPTGAAQRRHTAFVIGPEGGWSPAEFELLRAHAELVSLGPNVLRAETAALSALSIMHGLS